MYDGRKAQLSVQQTMSASQELWVFCSISWLYCIAKQQRAKPNVFT